MFGLGGGELVVIVLVALLVFGPKRLPEVAKGIARAYGEFQRWRNKLNNAVSDLRQEINIDMDEPLLKPGSLFSADKTPASLPRQVPELNRTTQDIKVPVNDDYLAPPSYDNPVDVKPGPPVGQPADAVGADDYLAGGGE